jgi:methionyl-tRNA formyltransferase
MNIIFFGTPYYVIPVLEMLHKKFRSKKGESPIVAVVTQRPKPSGRDKFLQYSEVDTWSHKRNIPILFEPEKVLDYDAEIGVLASYGEIIPKSVIKHFPKGILNIHPSLLPKYRGASPVQATLVAGDKIAGSSVMLLDEKLDHGPVVTQFKEDILPDDNALSLRDRLFARSAEVLAGLIPAYLQGKTKPKEQEHEKAIITRQIIKDDAHIEPKAIKAALNGKSLRKKWEIPFIRDFTANYSPIALHNFIRAMQPWPVAWTHIKLGTKSNEQETKRLLLHKSHLESVTNHQSPTTNHQLVLDEVQLEGKGIVSWKQFKEGYPEAKFV